MSGVLRVPTPAAFAINTALTYRRRQVAAPWPDGLGLSANGGWLCHSRLYWRWGPTRWGRPQRKTLVSGQYVMNGARSWRV